MGRVSKERVAEVQEQMKETRRQDTVYLRDVINNQLEEMKKKKKTGLDMIAQLEAQLENTKIKVHQLNGAIEMLLVLTKMSQAKAPEEKNND